MTLTLKNASEPIMEVYIDGEVENSVVDGNCYDDGSDNQQSMEMVQMIRSLVLWCCMHWCM